MAELLPCPFCGGTDILMRNVWGMFGKSPYARTYHYMQCRNCFSQTGYHGTKPKTIEMWNTRTPKERGADKQKITCLNCKHLMFSDMYGECKKQLRIVNPSDTCEYAETKERGGEK